MKMASKLILGLCVIALCLGLAHAGKTGSSKPAAAAPVPATRTAPADPCAPAINFFPTAEEIGEAQLVNNKTCAGSKVCNFPAVWQKANQTKYTSKLKTSLSKGLFRVAFKQYGNEKPRLFFTPDSKFLSVGEDVTECAASRMPTAARRLLHAYTVVRPGRWSYTVAYDGNKPETGKQIADQSGELDPLMLSKDGSHCANITVAVEGMQVSPSIPDLPDRLESTQTVCWIKMSNQPKATIKFDMCTTQKFTLNVSNVYPLAQNLTQNGSNVVVDGEQQMLLRPVIHLFGQKNKSLDGTVLKELEFDNLNNRINFINKYIMLPSTMNASETLSIVLDQDYLEEGYYKLSAKVAMISQFPDLVDLDGKAPVVQADWYGDDVRGYTEYLGVTVVNDTELVGVQRSKTTISTITSDRNGMPIKNGDNITFSWKMVGIGTEKCYHDDVLLTQCGSPLSVQAKDVSQKDTHHTFRVVFTDVCGNKKDANFSYTQQGVTTVSKVDYVPVDAGLLKPPPPRELPKTENSAAGLSSGSFASKLLMGLAGIGLMAAML